MWYANIVFMEEHGRGLMNVSERETRTSEMSREVTWKNLICKIDGVQSARVVFGERGEVEEIHVIADERRTAKQVTRDIQSALMAAFDAEIDYRVISVARIPVEESREESLPVQNVRLLYEGIDLHSQRDSMSVGVRLGCGDREYEGLASCQSGAFSRQRMVAMATVGAINEFMGAPVFELIDVQTAQVSGRAAVLASVNCVKGPELLLGGAFLRDDADKAVVKATMDAVNRRVSYIKRSL